ncbi:hypothetical protein Gpo141_00002340 [Globisporangium polare]
MAKGSSAPLIVVYVLLVLFLAASVGYGYYAWHNYRHAMDAALERRRARALERGDRIPTNDYWARDAPDAYEKDHRDHHGPAHKYHHSASASATVGQYHPIAAPVHSPSSKQGSSRQSPRPCTAA